MLGDLRHHDERGILVAPLLRHIVPLLMQDDELVVSIPDRDGAMLEAQRQADTKSLPMPRTYVIFRDIEGRLAVSASSARNAAASAMAAGARSTFAAPHRAAAARSKWLEAASLQPLKMLAH